MKWHELFGTPGTSSLDEYFERRAEKIGLHFREHNKRKDEHFKRQKDMINEHFREYNSRKDEHFKRQKDMINEHFKRQNDKIDELLKKVSDIAKMMQENAKRTDSKDSSSG